MAEQGTTGQDNAGEIRGTLRLDFAQWISGLQQSTIALEAFQRRVAQLTTLPDLKLNTQGVQQNLAQVEQLYQQSFARLEAQQREFSRRQAVPAPGRPGAVFGPAVPGIAPNAVPSAVPRLPSLPPPPHDHITAWEAFGVSIARFNASWGQLFGSMGGATQVLNEVGRGLGGIGAGFTQTGAAAAAAGGGLTAFVGGLAAAVVGTGLLGAGLLYLSKQAGAFGDALDREHLATGVAIQDLQAMETAAKLSGDSLETLRTVIRTLQRTSAEALRGPGPQRSMFEQLLGGDATAELLKAQDPSKFADFLAKVAAAILKLRAVNVTEAGQVSGQLLGRGYQESAELLGKLAEGMERVREASAAIHSPVSDADITMLADYDERWKGLWDTISKFASLRVGAPVARFLSPLLGVTTQQEEMAKLPAQLEAIQRERAALEAQMARGVPGVPRTGAMFGVERPEDPAQLARLAELRAEEARLSKRLTPAQSATPAEPISPEIILNTQVQEQNRAAWEALRKAELAALHEAQATEIERTQGALAGTAARKRFKEEEIAVEERHTRAMSLNNAAVFKAQQDLAAAVKEGRPTVGPQKALDAAIAESSRPALEQIKKEYDEAKAGVADLTRTLGTLEQAPAFRVLVGQVALFGATLATGERELALYKQQIDSLLQAGGSSLASNVYRPQIDELARKSRATDVALQPQRLTQDVGKELETFQTQQRQTGLRLQLQLEIDPRPVTAIQEKLRALQEGARQGAAAITAINATIDKGGYTPTQFEQITQAMYGVARGTKTVEAAWASIQQADIFKDATAQGEQFHTLLTTLAEDPRAITHAMAQLPSLVDEASLTRTRAILGSMRAEVLGLNKEIQQVLTDQAIRKTTDALGAQATALREQTAALSLSLDKQQATAIVQGKLKALADEGIKPSGAVVSAMGGQADEIVRLQHAYADAERPLQAFAEAHRSAFVTMQDTTLKVLQTSEQALVEFFVTGKANAADFGQAIVRDIATAFVRQNITKPLAGLLDSVFQQGKPGTAGAGLTGGGEGLSGAAIEVTGALQAVASAANTASAALQTITETPLRRVDGTLATGALGTTATGSAGGDAQALQAIIERRGAAVATPSGAGTLTPLQQMVVRKSQALNLDPSWTLALAQQESQFDPKAKSPRRMVNGVWEGGVEGLFQVTNKTGARYGQTPETRADPEVSTDAGLGYLKDLLKQTGGDYPAALRRYNGTGPTQDPNFPANVARYRPGFQAMLAGQGESAAPLTHAATSLETASSTLLSAAQALQSPPTAATTFEQAAAWRAQLPNTQEQLGDVTPMARGGLVTRPTHALLGEAGPELVVPMADGGVVDSGGSSDLSTLWVKFLGLFGKTPESEGDTGPTTSGTDWQTLKRKLAPILGAAIGGSLPQALAGGTDLTAAQEAYQEAFATHRDPRTGHLLQGGTYDYDTARTTGGSDLTSSLDWASKVPGAQGYRKPPPAAGSGSAWSAILSLIGTVAGAYAGKYAAGGSSGGQGGGSASGDFGGGSYPQYSADIAAASGGRFDRPTVALIGEAGPEAVVPLRSGGIPARMDRQGRITAHLPSGVDIPVLSMPTFAEGGMAGGGWGEAGLGAWSAGTTGFSSSRAAPTAGGGYQGPLVVFHVSTPDAGSFRASSDQLVSQAGATLRRVLARNS